MAKVLVVDDAGFVRRWCQRTLADNGHEVLEAANGAEAVQAFQDGKPDAVFLDVTMPVMDGLTALKEIRKLDPDARIAMLTAEGQLNIVLEARKYGARDFIIKPCEAPRLLASLQRILS